MRLLGYGKKAEELDGLTLQHENTKNIIKKAFFFSSTSYFSLLLLTSDIVVSAAVYSRARCVVVYLNSSVQQRRNGDGVMEERRMDVREIREMVRALGGLKKNIMLKVQLEKKVFNLVQVDIKFYYYDGGSWMIDSSFINCAIFSPQMTGMDCMASMDHRGRSQIAGRILMQQRQRPAAVAVAIGNTHCACSVEMMTDSDLAGSDADAAGNSGNFDSL